MLTAAWLPQSARPPVDHNTDVHRSTAHPSPHPSSTLASCRLPSNLLAACGLDSCLQAAPCNVSRVPCESAHVCLLGHVRAESQTQDEACEKASTMECAN